MKKRFPVILIVLCAAGFAAGIAWLFALRFETGDVYPEYSSLRADPLGSMAFYESLEKIPSLSVRRDFSTENRLPDQDGVTYLHLAGDPDDWDSLPEDMIRDIEGFLTRGGRLVITFFLTGAEPLFWNRQYESDDSESSKEKEKTDTRRSAHRTKSKKQERMSKKKEKDEAKEVPRASLKKRWGVGFSFKALEQGADDNYVPTLARNKTTLPLPTTLDWHSSVIFTNLDKAWQTIYARDTSAVVIERRFGHGSVVMATDSWFASNQALWKDRHADLLSWLVGANKNIVFDEAHFGVVENTGVAGLMRKYRLHGFIGGLILLAGLFIWKNSVSLVPVYVDQRKGDFVAGKDAAAGFVNLLRRNISAGDVLNTCFAEWKKSCPKNNPHTAARLKEVQSVLDSEKAKPRRERDPIAAYRTICGILKKSSTAKKSSQQ